MSKSNKILSSVLILAVLVLPNLVFADSLIEFQKKLLELEKLDDQYADSIAQKQTQVRTLKRDISILNDEISETKLKIQQASLAIQMTELDITDKQIEIEKLEQEITKQKTTLAEYIRMVNYYDQDSLLEILLSRENLSDVLNRVEALEVLQKKIHQTLEIIRANKVLTIEDKQTLEAQEEEQVALRKLQDAQKRSLQKKEQDKNKILTQTKGDEAKYQKLLSQNQIEIQQVKSQIRLLQSRGKQVLNLDEWIALSKEAEKLTGVKAALLMATLDQETDLGQSLGSCNYKSALIKGHEYEKKIFEDIVQELYPGQNPDEFLVSCPMSFGSGGAMGPAQFMPKTWLNMKNELTNLLGYTPNPWMPRDAIVAMALLLRNNGALDNAYQAACRYFGSCKIYNYGKSVVALAKEYQKVIDARV